MRRPRPRGSPPARPPTAWSKTSCAANDAKSPDRDSSPMDLHGILKTLVAHDTTSMRSNLALVEWIADVLAQAGCRVRVSRDPSKTKANLLAWLGPEHEGGAL